VKLISGVVVGWLDRHRPRDLRALPSVTTTNSTATLHLTLAHRIICARRQGPLTTIVTLTSTPMRIRPTAA
jgi:hypothetical protein